MWGRVSVNLAHVVSCSCLHHLMTLCVDGYFQYFKDSMLYSVASNTVT